MTTRDPGRRWRIAAASCLLLGLLAALAAKPVIDHYDRAYPPPLAAADPASTVVLDRNGALLRAFALPDGRWRLPVEVADVDPRFLAMLVTYEDRRFWSHRGADPLAMLRAAGQFLTSGEVISGASTLTMQVARLAKGERDRTFYAKLEQVARALQIERRFDKRRILALYLRLAPYGGNLEGVRAASLAYFGREPKRLSVAEAALLVALPQLPERRRPDRFPAEAEAARNRVLARMVEAGIIDQPEADRAAREPVPQRRLALPAVAPHLAQTVTEQAPAVRIHRVTIDRTVQERLESLMRERRATLGLELSAAILLADTRTAEILAHVGSPDFFDARRLGEIDMTRAVRSPGSALKPLIYGLAFEDGVVHPGTLIDDRPADFFGYRPTNFDTEFQGDLTVRSALQQSLNIPAVKLLDAVGPARLMARMRRAGADPQLPPSEAPGLAIGLGGLGLTLHDLVALYGIFPAGGKQVRLRDLAGPPPAASPTSVLSPVAAWYVSDALSGVPAPEGAPRLTVAYKTGTSYGYRDAWSVGFDGRYVIGVWVGRPDGASVTNLTGRTYAAPLLFEAFVRAGLDRVNLPGPPAGTINVATAGLPLALKRFTPRGSRTLAISAAEPAPAIVHPPDGARIDLGLASGEASGPLVLKLQGGRAPFRWLANGRPLPKPSLRRNAVWPPDSAGFSTLTVIDAAGRTASVRVFLE